MKRSCLLSGRVLRSTALVRLMVAHVRVSCRFTSPCAWTSPCALTAWQPPARQNLSELGLQTVI